MHAGSINSAISWPGTTRSRRHFGLTGSVHSIFAEHDLRAINNQQSTIQCGMAVGPEVARKVNERKIERKKMNIDVRLLT